MSVETECPYCGKYFNIELDDGYAEDEKEVIECPRCEKSFYYSVVVSLSTEAYPCECLNNGKHDFEIRYNKFPITVGEAYCKNLNCDEEICFAPELQKEFNTKFIELLKENNIENNLEKHFEIHAELIKKYKELNLEALKKWKEENERNN